MDAVVSFVAGGASLVSVGGATSVVAPSVTGSSANPSPTPTVIKNNTKRDRNANDRNETEFGRKNKIDFTGYLVCKKIDSKMVKTTLDEKIMAKRYNANHKTVFPER